MSFKSFINDNLNTEINESKQYDKRIKDLVLKTEKYKKELDHLYNKELLPLWEEINSHDSVLSVVSEPLALALRKIYHTVYNASEALNK